MPTRHPNSVAKNTMAVPIRKMTTKEWLERYSTTAPKEPHWLLEDDQNKPRNNLIGIIAPLQSPADTLPESPSDNNVGFWAPKRTRGDSCVDAGFRGQGDLTRLRRDVG